MGSAEVGDADEPATAITTLTVSSGASTQARASASGSRRQWRYLPGQSRPAGLVWSVWALLSITLIAYVARYGHNVPYYDEWGLAWFCTADNRLTLAGCGSRSMTTASLFPNSSWLAC